MHEVLTERRDDDVDLADLLDRLRAMLVQGLAVGKDVETALESVSIAGSRATALALVFSELLQNALEHGGTSVRIELARRNGDVVLAIADDGAGIDGDGVGTGLSIVRALVRDELGGSLSLENAGGLRAGGRLSHRGGGGARTRLDLVGATRRARELLRRQRLRRPPRRSAP